VIEQAQHSRQFRWMTASALPSGVFAVNVSLGTTARSSRASTEKTKDEDVLGAGIASTETRFPVDGA
jgi:hypothetical protein